MNAPVRGTDDQTKLVVNNTITTANNRHTLANIQWQKVRLETNLTKPEVQGDERVARLCHFGFSD